MANINYTSFNAGNSYTQNFDPAADVLVFDDPLLFATNFQPSPLSTGIQLKQINPADGSVIQTITLTFPGGAATDQFYKIHSGMFSFASGSLFLVGGNTDATTDDTSTSTLNGSAKNDLLASFGGSDTLNGGDGNDYMVTMGGQGGTSGGSGTDVFNGGNGTDTLGLDNVASLVGYNINLGSSAVGAQSVSAVGNSSTFTLSGIENVDGSDGNDTISGSSGNNEIYGAAGNDSISGGSGADGLGGDQGDDTLNGGSGYDRAYYFNSTPVIGVTVLQTGTRTYTVSTEGNDTISNIEELTLNGTSLLLSHVIDWGPLGNDSATAFDPATQTLAIRDSSLSAANFYVGPIASGPNAGRGITLTQFDPAGGAPLKTIHLIITGASQPDNFFKITSQNIVFANGSVLLVGDDAVAPGDNSAINPLTGGASSDLLISADGAQSISGGGGSDALYGGGGNDTLDGGSGNDFVTYEVNAAGAVNVNLDTGTVGHPGSGTASDSFGGTDTLISIESVRGTAYGDTLTGDAANANTGLITYSGRVFEGLAGNDTIDGGSSLPGNVTVASYNTSTGGVTVNLFTGIGNNNQAQGTANNDGFGTQDTLINVDFVVGSSHNDWLIGGSSSSQVIASNHFEQFDGGLGNDTIDGGEGTDRATYERATGSVTVNLDTDGNFSTGYSGTASGAAGNDILYSIEQVRGSNYNDTLTGGGGNDAFEGRGGDDVIHGGVQQLNGSDTLRFDQSISAVNVTFTSVGSGTATDGGFTGFAVGTDTFDGIESVRGSDFNDTMTGFAGGNEVFEGMTGNDSISGGTGGSDTVSYGSNLVGVTVTLLAGTTTVTDGWGGTDTLTDIENISGSQFNDTLTGNNGANTLSGQGGNDTLTGGQGNDTINGGFGKDTAVFTGTFGEYTIGAVQANGSYTVTDSIGDRDGTDTISGGIEVLSFSGSAVDKGITYTYSSLATDSEFYFNPLLDTLNLTGLGPQNFEISPIESGPNQGRGLQLIQRDDATGLPVKSISLLFTETSDPANMFKVSSSFLRFDKGVIMLGDNDASTATDDDSSLALTGGYGNDLLITAGGTQTVNGGLGDDVLITVERQSSSPPGSPGSDVFNGGAGFDTLGLDASITDGTTITQYTVNLSLGTNQGAIATTGAVYAGLNFTVTGIEAIDGSDVSDVLTGDGNANKLKGNYGTDTLVGGGGNDTLDGGELADSLSGGDGNDILIGGSGNDNIAGGNGIDVVDYSESHGDVTLTLGGSATSGSDTDTLAGDIENVIGSSWMDNLTGNALDNSFQGRIGADTIDGAGGTDTIDYSVDQNANGDALGVVVNLSGQNLNSSWQGIAYSVIAGKAQDGWGNTDSLSNVENILGSNYSDVLVGSAANNYINGGFGADILVGDAGNDTLDGGTVGPNIDSDWVSYVSAAAKAGPVTGVSVNLGTGTASGETLSVGSDILRNIDGVQGSIFNDSLVGGSDSSDFKGMKQEFFKGLDGNDTIDGGRGTTATMTSANFELNMAVYDDTTGGTGVNVDLAAGTATGNSSVGSDTLVGINAVRGSIYADTLTGGNATFDSVEFFEGNGGVDIINGGSGFDYAMYRLSQPGVIVDLALGTASNDGLGGNDTLTSIEGVIGSNFGDNITGSDGDNGFQGRAGNDTLAGGLGTDTADYSADYNANGDGLGVVVHLGSGAVTSWSGVAFNVAASSAIDGWGNTDTLSGIENVRGSIYNDFIIGNASANYINGGEGSDLLGGGGGTDTLDGGTVGASVDFDWVSFSASVTPVTVNLSTNSGGGATLFNIDGVFGGTVNDTLIGGSNSKWFNGVKYEWFQGGAGNDAIDGGRANNAVAMTAGDFELNWARYAGVNGQVVVNLANNAATSDGQGGIDSFLGINAVWGGNIGDSLTGGNALFNFVEIFNGSGGNDTIDGGSGNDIAAYRDATTGVNVVLDTVLGGTYAGTATDGLGGTDVLLNIDGVTGSNYDDTLTGGSDNDRFAGVQGNDIIDGGLGTDTVDYGNDYNANGDDLGVVVNLSGSSAVTSWKGVSFNVASGTALDGWGNTDTFVDRNNIENIDGSIYNDAFFGNVSDNRIDGGAGSDLLIGNTGNDTLDGGTVGNDSSSDWVSYKTALEITTGIVNGVTGVLVNLGANGVSGGTASGKAGSVDEDVLLNIDGVSGSIFHDKLIGGSASTDFKGFKQEFFYGDLGNDTIDGGRGTADPMTAANLEMNMAMYHNAATGVNVDLATQTVSNDGDGGADALIGINAVRGSSHDDTLTGGNSDFDYVEFFEGGGGNDTINGGSGFDYAMYTAATAGVNVNLSPGTPTATGDASVGTDTLTSIEGVVGSDFSDTITGGAGNEKLQGRMGNDVLDGGAGTDWVYYDGEQDGNGDGFGVTVNLTTGYAIDGWAGIDTLVNFENIRGSIYSDNLTGDGNNNVIWGQGGNDTINGGAGLDTAQFAGLKSEYTVTKVVGGFTVTDNYFPNGNDGVDMLMGIEKLQFADGFTSMGKSMIDFSGDGNTDLRWQNTDGSIAIWTMDGVNKTAGSQIYGPFAGWSVVNGQSDFNGDGKTDLLWGNTDGSIAIWTMDGVNKTAGSQIYGPFGGWSVVNEQSDFNGDGKTDLRWQNTDGSIAIWTMDGVNKTAGSQIYGPFAGWSVVNGRSDFNGDGKTDLLWGNTDGSIATWTMDGVNNTAGSQSYGPFAGWDLA